MATAVELVDPSEDETLAGLEARAKQANPFFRAMAHRPEVLRISPAIHRGSGPGSVPRRVKVLVYLACSYANTCPFCVASNLPGAHKAGITEDEIRAVETGNSNLSHPPNGRPSLTPAS